MKVFEHFPQPTCEEMDRVPICPICKTHDDKPCVLVAIDGTEDDNVVEACCVHTACLELSVTVGEVGAFIYQKLPDGEFIYKKDA